MPTNRTKAFEKIVIKEFLKPLNNIDLVEYPEPPDALVTKKDGRFFWIEVSSVYRDEVKPVKERTLAKSLNSTPPETLHHEYLGIKGEQEKNSVKIISERINKKDSKPNYKKISKQYGKGILLLYIDDPLACDKTIDVITNKNNYYGIKKLEIFHSVYLYIPKVFTLDARFYKDNRINIINTILTNEKTVLREGFTQIFPCKSRLHTQRCIYPLKE